jgi:hypothetical protein
MRVIERRRSRGRRKEKRGGILRKSNVRKRIN